MRESTCAPLPADARRSFPEAVAHRETVVEITTPLARDDPIARLEALTRGLDALRDAHRAVILAGHAADLPLAPGDLHPLVPMVLRRATGREPIGLPQMSVLPNEPWDVPLAPELDEDASGEVEASLSAIQARHPFVRYGEWLIAAKHARAKQYPEDAVLRAAIAMEAMLDAVLALALWESGVEPKAAAEVLAADLKSRLRRHFAPLLGGSWNLHQEGALREWAEGMAALRGRIVHRGHRPGGAEVERAFAAAEAMEGHVGERLLARRAKLPHTATLFFGVPALRRLGAFDGAVRRLWEAESAGDEDDWLREYDHWRRATDALVAAR